VEDLVAGGLGTAAALLALVDEQRQDDDGDGSAGR
jgi:hypothetical protein